jgi:hypothetical protein
MPVVFVVQVKNVQPGVFRQCTNVRAGEWSVEPRVHTEPEGRPPGVGKVADEDRSARQRPELAKGCDAMLIRSKVRDAPPAQDGG